MEFHPRDSAHCPLPTTRGIQKASVHASSLFYLLALIRCAALDCIIMKTNNAGITTSWTPP